jgi:transposase-like protein
MTPGRPRDPHKRHFWTQHLQCWNDSGLSVRDYCRTHRLHEHTFYHWRKKLRTASTGTTPITFLPLEVIHHPDQETRHYLELVLDQRRILRIPPGVDRDTLSTVLALLEEPSC